MKLLKTKILFFIVALFLFGCQKDEIQIGITEEIEKIEGFIANYDKVQEELKNGSTEMETRASDAYIAKIIEQLDKAFLEINSTAKVSSRYQGYIGGYLETTSGGCGSGSDEFAFKFDCEDGEYGSVSGNVLKSSADGNGNVWMYICSVNASLFNRMRNTDFALLMLGTELPSGISKFRRNFDTEDSNPANRILFNGVNITGNSTQSYLYSPNIVDNNITLYFYFYPMNSNSPYTMFPRIGRSYAVFGDRTPTEYTPAIYTNDEDRRNANSVTQWIWNDANGYLGAPTGNNGALYRIGHFTENTKLYYTVVY